MKFLSYAILLLAFLICPNGLLGQSEDPFEDNFEKKYQERIEKDFLFGVYIPKDITDAFIQLNQLIDSDSRKKFAAVPEEMASSKLHFSLGRWMIYNWQFYEGSRLSHYLREMGLSHPDDMARFIILTYHRNLNKKSLEVKPLIDSLANSRKEKILAKKKGGKVIHTETRKRSADIGQR
jgi:hypothetical protein